jgi:hypothetical protein
MYNKIHDSFGGKKYSFDIDCIDIYILLYESNLFMQLLHLFKVKINLHTKFFIAICCNKFMWTN